MSENGVKIRKPADNERFHASGGVCPQKHLWEFGSVSPARTFVNPRLREAATTLPASGADSVAGKRRQDTREAVRARI